MNQEQLNVDVVLRFVNEVFNSGHLEVLDQIAAVNWEDHSNRPLPEPGREGWKKRTRALRETFPDVHMAVEDIFAHADKVVVRYTVEGTEQVGKKNKFKASGITIARLSDGRIQENWNQFDELSRMRQLGTLS